MRQFGYQLVKFGDRLRTVLTLKKIDPIDYAYRLAATKPLLDVLKHSARHGWQNACESRRDGGANAPEVPGEKRS
jgi:hypothetical protein